MTPPRIYSCAEWHAAPPKQSFPLRRAKGAVVHHAVKPNVTPKSGDEERRRAFALARDLQRGHMKGNGWSDSGHHFTISRGGVILEGRHGSLEAAKRGRVPQGAHAGVDEGNRFYYGIEWEGTYHLKYLVTPQQWAAAVDLYAWLAFWGDWDTQNILPHLHFRPTQCPGLLRDRIDEFRREVHDRKLAILQDAGVSRMRR